MVNSLNLEMRELVDSHQHKYILDVDFILRPKDDRKGGAGVYDDKPLRWVPRADAPVKDDDPDADEQDGGIDDEASAFEIAEAKKVELDLQLDFDALLGPEVPIQPVAPLTEDAYVIATVATKPKTLPKTPPAKVRDVSPDPTAMISPKTPPASVVPPTVTPIVTPKISQYIEFDECPQLKYMSDNDFKLCAFASSRLPLKIISSDGCQSSIPSYFLTLPSYRSLRTRCRCPRSHCTYHRLW